MTDAKVISEEAAVAKVLCFPLPLIIIDTCNLGDIFRGILAGNADMSIGILDWLCSCANTKEFHVVIPNRVVNEFSLQGQFVQRELDALKGPASKWNAALEGYKHCGKFPSLQGIELCKPVDMVMVEKVYCGILSAISEVFKAAIIFESSSNARSWAYQRLNESKKPAKRGKDSFGDCEICGSAISLVSKLREKNFNQNVYFISANKADYMQGNALHPDLKEEFSNIQLTYVPTLLEVKGELFKMKNQLLRGVNQGGQLEQQCRQQHAVDTVESMGNPNGNAIERRCD